MEAGRGNRSFYETPSFSSPLSPQRYLPLYHNPEPIFAETSVQNNPFGVNPFDQTLETAFSRLNVSSTQKNQELGYLGFVDAEGLNVGFNETGRVGPPPDIGGWGQNNAVYSFTNNYNYYNNYLYNNSFRRPHRLQEILNCLSLGDMRGWFVSLAKHEYGSGFLQKAIGKASNEEIHMILMEFIDHVGELMSDPLANYVFQKLVNMCSVEQKTLILIMVTKDPFGLVKICLNTHGTRAVLKLLENLTTQQQISLVMSALRHGAVVLMKDMNGHRVIQYCLKNFSDEDNKYLLNEVADNCYQIATDQSGCCILQQCVDHTKGEARLHLVRAIIANAVHLAEDQYGNYVVQHVLELKEPEITASLLRQLEGNYASLSSNRYGSNVVEKCLKESEEQHSTRIIMELLKSKSPTVSTLLVDPFGNYVIQSALSVSKGFVYNALLNLVRVNSPMMQSHVHGKWILAWFNKRKKPQV